METTRLLEDQGSTMDYDRFGSAFFWRKVANLKQWATAAMRAPANTFSSYPTTHVTHNSAAAQQHNSICNDMAGARSHGCAGAR